MKLLLVIKQFFTQSTPQQKRKIKLSAGVFILCLIVAVSFQNCGQKFSTSVNTNGSGQYSVSSVAGDGGSGNGGGSGREATGETGSGQSGGTPSNTGSPTGSGGLGNNGGGGGSAVGGSGAGGGTTTTGSSCDASAFPASGKISWTDSSSGATCHVTLQTAITSLPANNGAGVSYTAYGTTSDSKPGSGRLCLKCVNNAIVLSTNPDSDCASYTGTVQKQFCQASTCSVRANYTWGSCAATNAASTLAYGASVTLQNTLADGSTGSVTLTCDRIGLNQNPSISNNTCQGVPSWQATSLKVDYPTDKISAAGILKEGERKFYDFNNPTVEISYDQMLKGASFVGSEPEYISPTKATLTECKAGVYPPECRPLDVDLNKLKFSVVGYGSDTTPHSPESNWVCINTGQSVAEKRGLIDCGARGAVLVMLNNSDPTLFNPPLAGAKVRGTISNYGSMGYAQGSFKIRAEITSATTGFSKYAGMAVEIPITLVNRVDFHITSNVTDIFATYGGIVFDLEILGENGWVNGATYAARACKIKVGTTEFPVTFDNTYSNTFRYTTAIKNAITSAASGTEVQINCEANYQGQVGSTFRVEKKP